MSSAWRCLPPATLFLVVSAKMLAEPHSDKK
jgi:hypothetical protein